MSDEPVFTLDELCRILEDIEAASPWKALKAEMSAETLAATARVYAERPFGELQPGQRLLLGLPVFTSTAVPRGQIAFYMKDGTIQTMEIGEPS